MENFDTNCTNFHESFSISVNSCNSCLNYRFSIKKTWLTELIGLFLAPWMRMKFLQKQILGWIELKPLAELSNMPHLYSLLYQLLFFFSFLFLSRWHQFIKSVFGMCCFYIRFKSSYAFGIGNWYSYFVFMKGVWFLQPKPSVVLKLSAFCGWWAGCY